MPDRDPAPDAPTRAAPDDAGHADPARAADRPRDDATGATALWYVAPGRAEIRPAALGEGGVRVETLWSGLSRGTERLVFSGAVPQSEHVRMRAPAQEGAFPFPVKYGYAAVGRVTEGPADLAGRIVFSLHPHQSVFCAHPERLLPVPEAVPPRRAILAANMETALNAVWDANPSPGSRVRVIGGGLVGCLTAWVAAHHAGCIVTLIDKLDARRAIADELAVTFASDAPAQDAADLVFHCSASAEGLAAGLDALRDEGRLIEMSWYGDRPVSVPLGGAFHAKRLTIASSQVGRVAPSRRDRIAFRDRLGLALSLLDDPRLDALITDEITFRDVPDALPGLFDPARTGTVGVAIAYR
ncbi:MAG: zinc-binding alcohol dehydrogenase [Pseudomonadota bacterium]